MEYSEWVKRNLPVLMRETGVDRVPKEEISSRIDRLKERLKENRIDSFLVLQKMDCYYFSGTTQDAMVFIHEDMEPLLIVKREYERARIESPLSNTVPIRSRKELPSIINNYCETFPRKMATELDILPANEYFMLRDLLKGTELIDGSPIIKGIRKIKSDWECQVMRRAGEIGRDVFHCAKDILRPGISEIEFGAMMELRAKKLGHEGLIRVRSMNYEAYSWHILSGWAGGIVSQSDSPMGGMGMSTAFPVGASRKQIQPSEPVLVDFGICYLGYQVDETRMFSIGDMPSLFQDAYRACLEIHMSVLEDVRPGSNCHELFQKSVEVAKRLGYEESYLGPPGFKTSFIGHGIGLELNEFPFVARGQDYPLEEGMTFALEPKLVFPGKGAVGVEDTILVTENGYEILTPIEYNIINV